MRAGRALLLALALAGLAALQPAGAQFASSKPKVHPRREDVKYIRCQVCELLAKNAYKQAKEMFKAATPSARVRRAGAGGRRRGRVQNLPWLQMGGWADRAWRPR